MTAACAALKKLRGSFCLPPLFCFARIFDAKQISERSLCSEMTFSDFDEFKNYIKGADIDVIGIGISNRPLIRFLAENGAHVTACDKRSEEALGEAAAELKSMGVRLCLGEDYLKGLSGELIFKTPGLRSDTPELAEAERRGSYITSEMEVFFEVCPAHLIGITGSDGKTTTTTLTYKMLELQGYKTYVGGNIGKPLLIQAGEMSAEDYAVLELSSFQLDAMHRSPERALITNLSPNHLDWHKDYAEYISSKCNIYLHQKPGDILVLNRDNPDTARLGAGRECIWFSKTPQNKGVWLDGGTIYRDGEAVLDISDIKIPGMHNVENYMAAIALVGDLVDKENIRKLAKKFGGVEHRIELVRTLDGVRYYNSSIDSSPNRTINTLRVFDKKVILIAGGKDKGIPYDELGAHLAERVKVLILIGATADKIEKSLKDEIASSGRGADVKVLRAKTYEEAVSLGRANASDGDIVLLSNASTSFDMFDNFEHRGRTFKNIVNGLK